MSQAAYFTRSPTSFSKVGISVALFLGKKNCWKTNAFGRTVKVKGYPSQPQGAASLLLVEQSQQIWFTDATRVALVGPCTRLNHKIWQRRGSDQHLLPRPGNINWNCTLMSKKLHKQKLCKCRRENVTFTLQHSLSENKAWAIIQYQIVEIEDLKWIAVQCICKKISTPITHSSVFRSVHFCICSEISPSLIPNHWIWGITIFFYFSANY